MRYTLSNFYQSKEWDKFRKIVIAERLNEEGLIICEHCKKPIIRSYDIIAHHIEELTEENVNDVTISMNPDNIKLVHHVCHNKIHHKFQYNHKKIYLVYGSPFSGKNSYVNEIRNKGDLVVDMNSIWECVSGAERYEKDGRLNACVFAVRDTLLDCIKYRKGKWTTAFVIGGYPLISERERLCRELGAEEIFVDSTLEECLERLEMCEDARKGNEWEKFILDWFEKYTPPTKQEI